MDVRECSHGQMGDFSTDDASRSPQSDFQLPPPHLQEPEQDYDSDDYDDVEIVPCPFESQSDGSLSNESSPSSSPASKYFKGSSESERIRSPRRSSRASVADNASRQAYVATSPTHTSEQHETESQDEDEDDINPYGEINTMRQDPKPSRRKTSSPSMTRYHRPTRSWSMTIQPFLFESAAVKGMIEASQEYMDDDQRSMMVERSEFLRIVWNASTRQEFVWIITTAMMDRSNPGEVCDPRLNATHN
ncbi:hypothetical protein BGZ58_002513 [Dissophora ornata]|nr:hypothetical protein BGZ58_002513 [Dissophora ornata]